MPPSHLAPAAKPLSGRSLSLAEREEIAIWRAQRHGVREIARRLKRAPSTISRELRRCARQIAISSRSANDRERPDSGFADGASCDGGMPPALRNQRAPTAGDTPAPTAASSVEHPVAIAAQN